MNTKGDQEIGAILLRNESVARMDFVNVSEIQKYFSREIYTCEVEVKPQSKTKGRTLWLTIVHFSTGKVDSIFFGSFIFQTNL